VPARFDELRGHIAQLPPGHTVLLTVQRDGETLELAAVLAERPDSDALARLRPTPKTKTRTRKPTPELPSVRTPKRLGVQARAIEGGLEVVDIEPGSLADQMRLQPGDVLRSIDGSSIADPADVARALAKAGNALTVEILRDGKLHRISFEGS
jgi:S1-C subfamily serine protease